MGVGSNPTSALFLFFYFFYRYLKRKRRFLLVIFKDMEISEARRRRAGILVFYKFVGFDFQIYQTMPLHI